MILNTHTKLGDHLLMCDGIISEYGEAIKVTSSDKLILAFMYHRWEFFKKSNQDHFDSMEFIALRTGNSVKTVERCISKFTKACVVIAEKRFDTKKKHNKWFWLGFKAHRYVTMDGDTIKYFIDENMSTYNPKPYYKEDKVTVSDIPEVPDYLLSVPDDVSGYIPEFNEFDYNFEMQIGVI
jgi:hypothetical protein